jgi:quercetin dioxygenase-like cupin family protein
MSFEKATQKILDYLALIPDECNKPLDRYSMKVKSGKIDIIGIANNNLFSIAKVINYPGSSGDWHTHNEIEHFILIDGSPYKMETKEGNEIKEYEVDFNKNCFILPNTPHRLKESSGYNESLVVLIPGSDHFPEGLEHTLK